MQPSTQSITGVELLDATFVDGPMLIAPFMPSGGHCLLHGKRGLGKTQLAHTLAVDVMLGLPFLGVYPTTQASVFYVQADITKQIQQERLQRLVSATGLDRERLKALRYMCFPGSFDCRRELDRGELWIDELREHEPGLVVVDTLRKSHGLDENLSNTPVEVYAAWRAIAGPRATLLYLHHDKKTSEFEVRDEAFRGSGAWLDEADLGMHLCKGKAGLFLDWSKLRTCSELDVRLCSLRLDPDSLMTMPDEPVESYVQSAMLQRKPREEIIAGATDAKRWGERIMHRRTVQRRLQGYDVPQA